MFTLIKRLAYLHGPVAKLKSDRNVCFSGAWVSSSGEQERATPKYFKHSRKYFNELVAAKAEDETGLQLAARLFQVSERVAGNLLLVFASSTGRTLSIPSSRTVRAVRESKYFSENFELAPGFRLLSRKDKCIAPCVLTGKPKKISLVEFWAFIDAVQTIVENHS